MAVSAKTIKTKIHSVQNIQKITKAMELVSVSKMKRAVTTALGTRPYAERALELLLHLSRIPSLSHPLMTAPEVDKRLLVIVASNKGLAGSFNINVAKTARTYIHEHPGQYAAVTIGKYAERIARSHDMDLIASFLDFTEHIQVEDAAALSKLILDEFESGTYREVSILYTTYVNALSNVPTVRQLLPISVDTVGSMLQELIAGTDDEPVATEDLSEYLLEPNAEELLEHVLRRLTEVGIFQALIESHASEHSARMLAMKNATENAGRLVDDLTFSYNQARQDGITRELSEIASGADALQSAR